ncbi:molybdenum cofactor guanylyltransferase [Asticcacaulis sp. 201]|uniref:molybdenum cofactor guanylyltransferase n=1 Tax=Asticcacaulis sp. 201 TaxID=3028787 RepID=UPI002916DA9D|nr:molybdenum cofactor guanylyltransferase [Asticcacaulis sp. 201]MDV6331225.1 molybdenum cofactor guanylyltransferase [Asticcacaulis sp. 201]
MTTIVVLAGGRGSRLGGNKPLHPWAGSTLIEATIDRLRPQADALLINASEQYTPLSERLAKLGFPLLFDKPETRNRGPLSGVLTALGWADIQHLQTVITSPCDMPHLPSDIVERLDKAADFDAVFFSGRRDYPLCARWHTRLLSKLAPTLSAAHSGVPVMRFLDDCTVLRLPVEDDAAFANINTPADVE